MQWKSKNTAEIKEGMQVSHEQDQMIMKKASHTTAEAFSPIN
jgi:hypothetical protein